MSVCKADTYPRYGSIAVTTVAIDHTRILAWKALFFSLVGVDIDERNREMRSGTQRKIRTLQKERGLHSGKRSRYGIRISIVKVRQMRAE